MPPRAPRNDAALPLPELTAPPSLRPYMGVSLAAHAGLFLLLWPLLSRIRAPKSEPPSYTIDFIGPAPELHQASSGGETRVRKGPSLAAPRRRIVLPRPSLFESPQPAPQEEQSSVGKPEKNAAKAGSEPGLKTDFPNFPYPWYLTQIRAALWRAWSADKPSGTGEAAVVFSLLKDGTITDLRIEASSGDPVFDLAAQSAVMDAAPYPPLPSGFPEPFLRIHVSMRSF